ncbi:MAG TPA: phosphatidylglycerol lysyltransferase domain-containing protein [Candidatus Limnocylindrales bacterium]
MTWTSTAPALHWGRRPLRTARRLSGAAPAILVAAGAFAAGTYLFSGLRDLGNQLDFILPIDPADSNPTIALLSAVGLAALAIGLLRSKSGAWWLAMATLSVSLLAQAQALSHPLVVVAVGGLLAILLADRRRYTVETDISGRRLILALMAVGGLAIGLETALIIATTGDWPRPFSALSDITAATGNAFGVSDPTRNQVLRYGSRDAIIGLLLVASRLPIVLAALGILNPVSEPRADPSSRERARSITRQYGCGALFPFQMGDDKLVFSPSDVDGLVVYGLAGRTAVVLGDLIGPVACAPIVLDRFLKRCHKLDRTPVIYQASSVGRAMLTNAGFRVFKVGEEAIVDLSTFQLNGHRRANLRHTVTRCRKDGVSFQWFAHGIPPDEATLIDEMAAIDSVWRKKAGPQLGFTINQFHRASLAWQPCSVALGPAGHVIAFVTFRQTGTDGGRVLDLMRRSPDGSPGAVEACIVEAASALKESGAPTLSLGLAPLAGISRNDPMFEERLLAAGSKLVRPWYDVQGLARFKNKFDPEWLPRYGATRRRRDLIGFVTSLLRVHLNGSIDMPWRKLYRVRTPAGH